MNYKVHHLGGLIATEAVLISYNQPVLSFVTPLTLIGGYFMGIIADIDTPQSAVSRRTGFISPLFQLLNIRHRSLTHSLIAIFLIWSILKILPIPEVVVIALTLAYASHPFLDLFNEEGVELFYPFSYRIKLLPGFLAVSSDEYSPTQYFIYQLFNVVHLFLFLAIVIPISFDVPYVGMYIQKIWYNIVSYLPNELATWLK